jgi:hypothetical protein
MMSLTFSHTVTMFGCWDTAMGSSSASAWVTVAPGMPMLTKTVFSGMAVR